MQQVFGHKFFDAAGGVQFLTSTEETWDSFVQRQAADLHTAIDRKDSTKVQELITHGGADISMIDKSVEGSTVQPLHRAAFAGDAKVMRVLLAEVHSLSRTHAGTHACRHACRQVCRHAHLHACMQARRLHACMHTRLQARTPAGTHACRHARLQAHTHAGTHACRHARMHARTHACRSKILGPKM